MSERVLVLPRDAVPGGCDFTGMRNVRDATLELLRDAIARHGRYLERSVAERDPSFKQLIPYVVVRDGGRVFLMWRTSAGGDDRLHGKASIGVGGHLNPVDAGADPLLSGLQREWAEELDATWEPQFQLAGMLNDDSNAVGAVHIGIVFVVDAAGRELRVRERHKLHGAFEPPQVVAAAWDRLETWSRLVATSLAIAPSAAVENGGA